MLRIGQKPHSAALKTISLRRTFSISCSKNHGGNQGGQASASKTDGLSLKRIAAMEKAQENKYFRELQVKQIRNLKLEPTVKKLENKSGIEKSNTQNELDEIKAELAALKAELSKKTLELADLNQKK